MYEVVPFNKFYIDEYSKTENKKRRRDGPKDKYYNLSFRVFFFFLILTHRVLHSFPITGTQSESLFVRGVLGTLTRRIVQKLCLLTTLVQNVRSFLLRLLIYFYFIDYV